MSSTWRNENIKIAWDLDGVLCDIDIATLRLIDNEPNAEARQSAEEWYYRERKPLLDARLLLSKDDEFYIITSRPERLQKITKLWVKHYYPQARLYFVSQESLRPEENNNESIKNWCFNKVQLKAQKINELGIDVYFDDEAEAFEEFRKLCPNCKIIKYGGRLEL